MKLMTFLLGSLLVCSGCTVQEVRTNPSGKDVFDVNDSAHVVYRKLITNARDEYATGTCVVDGDYYQDEKQGRISCTMSDALGMSKFVGFAIDIDAINDTKSRVTTYYGVRTWKSICPKVREWCKGPAVK